MVLGIDPEGGRRALDVSGWKDQLEGEPQLPAPPWQKVRPRLTRRRMSTGKTQTL